MPTLNELGYGKEKVASWFALAAPAGTPPAVDGKLNELFIKASRDRSCCGGRRKITPIATSTPEHMGSAMEQEWQTMQQLAKVLNLKAQ